MRCTLHKRHPQVIQEPDQDFDKQLKAICPPPDEWPVTQLLIPGLGVKKRPGSDCSWVLMRAKQDRDPVIQGLEPF